MRMRFDDNPVARGNAANARVWIASGKRAMPCALSLFGAREQAFTYTDDAARALTRRGRPPPFKERLAPS